jgi:hypothetical protein
MSGPLIRGPQGDMQLKRNTTCEKRWKKNATTSVSNQNELSSHPGDLQRTREYSNLGVISTFHLNHFKVTRFTKII